MKARHLLPVLAAAITFPALSSPVMTLTSQDIQEGSRMAKHFVFNGFGCSGDNLSPQLSWNNAPKGTKSFAITAYDPDAPTGSGWWHWVALDIAADQHNVARGAAKQLKGVRELNTITALAALVVRALHKVTVCTVINLRFGHSRLKKWRSHKGLLML